MSAQTQLIMELAERMAVEPRLEKRQTYLAAMIKIYNGGGTPSHKMQDHVRQLFGLRGRLDPKKRIDCTVELPPSPKPAPPIPKKVERVKLLTDRYCVHCDSQLVLDGTKYSCPKCEAVAIAAEQYATAPEPDYSQVAVNVPAQSFLDAPTRKVSGPGTRLYTHRTGTEG